MAVIGIMLVKDEASRELSKTLNVFNLCLKRFRSVCDKLIILDDHSTDDTFNVCKNVADEIYVASQSFFATDDLKLRKMLWDKAIKKANDNDWIFCLDADELLCFEHIPYIKYIFKTVSTQIDAIGCKLYDMWSTREYRDDKYWQAHKHYWAMAVRYKKDYDYTWFDKTLHCGRLPKNAAQSMLPTQIPIMHMGYALESERIKKHNRYMEIDPDGKNGILEQYKDILNDYPNLVRFGGKL